MSTSFRKLTGIVPPIGTPLTPDERVDTAGLRRLVRYLLDAGVHALFANGTMSGFAFLTDDEQIRAIETVVDETNGRVPVMAGLGETGTARGIARARLMERTGASHLSILTPYYFYNTQEHIIAYCSEIASAVSIPVLLYDNPVMTKSHMHPETIALLRSRIPHLIGMKESNQDCLNLQKLIETMRGDDGFSILTGSEALAHVHLMMGVEGCVGGIQNVCPRIAVELYEAHQRGDVETARRKQRDLSGTWEIFRYGSVWGGFDEALRYLGIAESATGRPYRMMLNEDDRRAVHAILDRYVGRQR